MEQWEFFIREAINRPEIELKVRAVFAENTALHEENAELKNEEQRRRIDRLAELEAARR